MPEHLTILFAPLDAVGHVNACIGIAQVLRDRGHRIVFAISDNWKETLKIYGFEEEIIELSESKEIEDPAKFWAQVIVKTGLLNSLSPIEKMKNMSDNFLEEMLNRSQKSDPILKEIVERIKPDIIVIDGFVWLPSLMNSGIPWVWSMRLNPLAFEYGMDDERLPPSTSGKKLISQSNNC
jgi:hypothetical protein